MESISIPEGQEIIKQLKSKIKPGFIKRFF